MSEHHPGAEPAFEASRHSTPIFKRFAALSGSILLFLILCCAVLPYAGIEGDEALFAGPLYSDVVRGMKMRAFHHDIPLMLMSYLGTAKTWLYAPVFRLWPPGLISLRLPAVLIGAVTLLIVYELLLRSAGRLTAIAACLLLATDASYILTTTLDWGPVAIQHLTFTGGLLCLLVAFRRCSAAYTGAGFFLFGLGMWDKAIFIWVLSGAAIAALLLFRSEVRTMATPRNLIAACLGVLAGASPLIIYNARNEFATFRGNVVFSNIDLENKMVLARRALSGSALFGYVAAEEHSDHPKQARNSLEQASLSLRELTGEHRDSLLPYAFIGAVLAAPLWWPRRRLTGFVLIVMAVAWLQMAFTKGAGTGLHHVVLLWPWPHVVIAVALAEGARRLRRGSTIAFTALLALLCVSNLLVVNQYLSQFIRNGTSPEWTDAILPLSARIAQWQDGHVFITDWGMDPTLKVLHQGRMQKLWNVSDVFSHELSTTDRAEVERMLTLGGVFITHTPRFELQAGSAERLFQAAAVLGYHRHLLARIDDSNGRAAFEIVEFAR